MFVFVVLEDGPEARDETFWGPMLIENGVSLSAVVDGNGTLFGEEHDFDKLFGIEPFYERE